MLYAKAANMISGLLTLSSNFVSGYQPSEYDVIVVSTKNTNGNMNLWVEWDNYNQVWKVHCSDSSYSGEIHCMIQTI